MIGMGAAFDFHLAIADALEWEKRSGLRAYRLYQARRLWEISR
jgi:hypothetical protein